MKFWFKHEYWGDEWQDFYTDAFDAEHAAQKLAEDHYHDDPCDPRHFDFTVDIKDESGKVSRINVTAEADVNFYANAVESE